MSSAARAFEQRSAAAVAQVVAELDNAGSAPDTALPPSPSLASGSGGLDFRAAQIEKDAKMAEELQREEYRKEEVRTERRRQRQAAAVAEQNASWTDWLVGSSPSAGVAPTNASSSASASAQASSMARPTSSLGGGRARVAKPSGSMFACVAQSITSVMGPPQSQVSGVDSSSLI
jgi:hypothetical protein